ncbi:MAG: trypsin-like peptidase domain-containing protein [Planctomycetota bacterium]|nr:trypsin-like peptidase domain-containing protein [Planctomycetota bacterium]
MSIQLVAAALALTSAGETVLLDFQADWCGPCKMMEPAIDQLASMGYPVRKVDIDRDPALARQHGVTNVPCLVLLVNGQERGRQVGTLGIEQLLQMLNQANVRPAGTAVAQVRGQSPDRRRFGWPRSRPTASNNSTANIPRVSLGEPVAPPASPSNSIVAAPNPPATQPASWPNRAPAAPAATRPPSGFAQATPPPLTPIPPRTTTPSAPPSTTLPASPPPTTPPPAAAPAANSVAPVTPPAAATPADPDALTERMIQRLTAATVRIEVKDDDGQSFGSGTIIEFRPAAQGAGGEALVLTCGHIFRNSEGKGPIQVDLFDGSQQQDLPGSLVRYDLARDIGLIKFTMPHNAQSAQLASPDDAPARGNSVISIGCDHGQPPTAHRSQVMAVNSFVGPPNLQVSGQPAIGRSGGGLFNDRGELIGVCNFADPTDRAGLYAAVEVAREVIDQSGIVLKPNRRSPVRMATPVIGKPMSRIDIGSPAGALSTAGPPAPSGPNRPTEVICVVRTNDGANTQRQVIVIEDASSEFINKLAREQQKQRQTFQTTMDTQPTRPAPSFSQRPVIRTTTDWQPKWK